MASFCPRCGTPLSSRSCNNCNHSVGVKKTIVMATILSSIIPGLGHIYIRRYLIGIVYLFLLFIFIGTGILFLMASLWLVAMFSVRRKIIRYSVN